MLKKIKVSVFFIGFFLFLIIFGFAVEAFSLLFALIIHEAGHILAAKALGCKVEKLLILPLGGYMQIDQLIEVQPQIENRIALAGPMANLLAIAVIIAVSRPEHEISLSIIRANLTLMAFNLLPALPLDGGRVLRSRLAGWVSYYRATEVVIFSGGICGLLLFGLSIYGLLHGSPNPTLIAAGLFLLYNAYIEKKQLLVPLIRYVLRRQDSLRKSSLMSAHLLVAAPGTKVNEVLKHIRPQKYYQVSVLDNKYKICGTLTEHQLLKQITSGTGQMELLDVVDAERKE